MPVLVGPLQVLLAVLPGILVALGAAALSLLRPRTMKLALILAWRLKLPLVALAAVGAGACWGVARLWPAPAAGAAVDAADWLVFRGGPARLGAVPGDPEPDAPALVWQHRLPQEAFYCSPALSGNRLYAVSASLGVFSRHGEIYAFDADTGAVAWKSAPEGYRPTFSSPAVSGRRLVVGEGLHDTRDARVVCLDLTPGREGKVLWTHRTAGHVECTPVIDAGRVFVGAGDDGFWALDLETGRVLWHLAGDRYPDAETGLAVYDGTLYAGLGVGGRALCKIKAATGRELARLATPFPVFCPPAIHAGRLYVGMGNGNYVQTAEEAREQALQKMRDEGKSEADLAAAAATMGPGGEVWCVDLAGFTKLWSFALPDAVLGAVAVDDEGLFFGVRDGQVHRLGHDGRPVARWNAGAPVIASPALAGRLLYVIANSGTLTALSRSLEPVWEMTIGTEPIFISSPVVGRGRVFVGSQADGLVCAGTVGGRAVPVESPLPTSPVAEGEPIGGVTAPPAAAGEELFIPTADGVLCLNRWRAPFQTKASPVVAGDLVCVLADGELVALRRRDGSVAWRLAAEGPLAASADALFAGGRCVDLRGRVLWTAPFGGEVAVLPSMVVIAGAELAALDRPTGALLWRCALGALTPPLVRGDRIYVGTDRGIEARSLLDGAPLWKAEGRPSAGFVILSDELATVSDELIVLDLRDGSVKRRAPARPGCAPLAGRGRLAWATEAGLMLEGEPWVDLKAAFLTMAGPRLCVGTADGRLRIYR